MCSGSPAGSGECYYFGASGDGWINPGTGAALIQADVTVTDHDGIDLTCTTSTSTGMCSTPYRSETHWCVPGTEGAIAQAIAVVDGTKVADTGQQGDECEAP